jgi:two-component system, response regulator RegA
MCYRTFQENESIMCIALREVTGQIRRVIVAHPPGRWRDHFVHSLQSCRYQVHACEDSLAVKSLVADLELHLVVTELRLVDGPALALLAWLKRERPKLRTVVATDHGSIATAVRCTRLGVDGYFCKPVSCDKLVGCEHTDGDPCILDRPMRLERAVWEYLHRAVDSAGSISQGAQLLGLDRRSLRRMLGKYAPPA